MFLFLDTSGKDDPGHEGPPLRPPPFFMIIAWCILLALLVHQGQVRNRAWGVTLAIMGGLTLAAIAITFGGALAGTRGAADACATAAVIYAGLTAYVLPRI